MKRVLTTAAALLFLLGAAPAEAGDPCPIGFPMIDLGIPKWAKPELQKKVADGDPLFKRMVALAKKQECAEVTQARVTGDSLPLRTHQSVKVDLAMAKVEKALFKKNRGFECKRSAKRLTYLYEAAYDGAPVLMLRGHRRILFVVAGWNAECVEADKADAWSDAELLTFWKKLTHTYVKDRHDNP